MISGGQVELTGDDIKDREIFSTSKLERTRNSR